MTPAPSTGIPAPDCSAAALAQNALNLTSTLIDRFGGRLVGTDACRQAGEALRRELERACGRAVLEPFTTRPGAFTGFYRIDAVVYLVSVALLFLNQPLIAACLMLFTITTAGLEFGWYVEVYDWLYPRKDCANAAAALEPQAEPRQTLIFSGHHDSAQELNFLKRRQKLYGLKIVVPDFFRFLALTMAWVWAINRMLSGPQPFFVTPARWLLVVGIYFVFTKFFLFSSDATPGAGDNLIASAMVVALAERFAAPGQPGRSVLDHTRLVFLSFDAEEAGVRGSRAWVKAHRAELAALPTTVFNMDSIYRAEDVQFMLSDLNSHVALDRKLAQTCVDLAHAAGLKAGFGVMRFGGGATDAVNFARVGVSATTLIAMSSQIVRDGLVYHTMRDTVDAIEPAAVAACLTVAERLALALDQN